MKTCTINWLQLEGIVMSKKLDQHKLVLYRVIYACDIPTYSLETLRLEKAFNMCTLHSLPHANSKFAHTVFLCVCSVFCVSPLMPDTRLVLAYMLSLMSGRNKFIMEKKKKKIYRPSVLTLCTHCIAMGKFQFACTHSSILTVL